jgi:hypothetical protein
VLKINIFLYIRVKKVIFNIVIMKFLHLVVISILAVIVLVSSGSPIKKGKKLGHRQDGTDDTEGHNVGYGTVGYKLSRAKPGKGSGKAKGHKIRRDKPKGTDDTEGYGYQ